MQSSHAVTTAALEHDTERLIPFLAFAIAFAIMLALRNGSLLWLGRTSKGRRPLLTAVIEAIKGPSWFWCFAAAIAIAIRYAEWPLKWVDRADMAIDAVVILSVSWALSTLAVRMVTTYGEERGLPFAAAGLFRAMMRTLIFLIGLALLLWKLNLFVVVTPILTALGVGGLAVALALQDTMANFFAGIHILIERPIALGDFIKLQTGEEGTVNDIGWRTTRIRTGANNVVVIPNKVITSGVLTNYGMPTPRVVSEVAIFAGLDADPDAIASLALDAAAETEGVMVDPAATVIFDPGVLLTHIQMKLIFHAAKQQDAGAVASALRVLILKKFRDHGVPLPSTNPHIVVNT